jgi:DNA-binding beta-propeller fold protein YncE
MSLMPYTESRRRWRFPALYLTLVLAGCLSPVDPLQQKVAAVRVVVGARETNLDTIQVRGTTRVRASALAREGFDIGLTNFTYRSSDETVVVVDSTGVARGLKPGTANITATLPSGQGGSVAIVVVPSTIAYTIPAGASPTGLAFSVDYTRAYAVVGGDSVAIIDAIGFFRIAAVRLGLTTRDLAATTTAIYATHPDVDSVSVISPATSQVTGRIFVGAGPGAIVASANRAYVATRYDRKIVILENGAVTLGIPVGGEPVHLAVSRDGKRLFSTVQSNGAWRVVVSAPEFPDTIASFAIDGTPSAIATNVDGSRVYVLQGAEGKVSMWAATGGAYLPAGSVAVTPGSTGIGVRQTSSTPYVVVSGSPTTVFDGETLAIVDQIVGLGNGVVAVRPDGLFAFVAVTAAGFIYVLQL